MFSFLRHWYYTYPQFFLPAVIVSVMVVTVVSVTFVSSSGSSDTVIQATTPTVADTAIPDTTEAPAAATADVTEAVVAATSEPTEAVVAATAEATVDGAVAPTAQATPIPVIEVANPPLIVIEGPVKAINVNTITIFDIDIEVDPASPIWVDLRVGDTVRVEGNTNFNGNVIIIVAVNITIIDIDVVIVDGVVINNLPANCKFKSNKIKCKGSGRGS